jgi:hypothetical protein
MIDILNEDIIGDVLSDIFGGDPKKKEIAGHMKKLAISDYTINKDYSVDTNKDVYINAKKIEVCPVNFNIAKGNFTWHFSDLKSMKNLPKAVHGNFSVVNNKLTSLKDSQTKIVKGVFNISNNNLRNLEGCPQTCGGFIASNCGLESLAGGPEEVHGDFIIVHNSLTSLEGGPGLVSGTYDCSNNKLMSLDGITRNRTKKIRANDNPGNFEKQLHIDFDDYKEKEEIIYTNDASKWSGMTAEIVGITEPDSEHPERRYHLKFHRDNNEGLDKDVLIANAKAKHFKRTSDTFIVGDYVVYINPKSKYNGFKGTIETISTVDEQPSYTVKFEFDENPGLIDVVNATNRNRTNVNIKKITRDEIEKTLPDIGRQPNPDASINVRPTVLNKFKVGDEAIYGGIKKVRIASINTSYHWNVYYTDDPDMTVFSVHYSSLAPVTKKFEVGDTVYYKNRKAKITKKNEYRIGFWEIEYVDDENAADFLNVVAESELTREPRKKEYNFQYGDKIIYIDPNSEYDECKGTVTHVNYRSGWPIVDIRLKDRNGNDKVMVSVDPDKIDIDIWAQKEKPKPKPREEDDDDFDFKKGDKVIYTNINSPYYLAKGEITGINRNYVNPSYTVLLHRNDNGKITSLEYNFVYPDFLVKDTGEQYVPPPKKEAKFKKGDKVVYISSGEKDKNNEFHLRKGTISFINEPNSYYPERKDITYDIKMPMMGNEKYEKSILFAQAENIRLDTSVFNVGDKVIYHNEGDEYDGKPGTVTKIEGDEFNVTFNNIAEPNETMTIMKVLADDLTKFSKPIGSEVHLDDDIIYTKPDSKYFGCKGTVKSYDISADKPYSIELKAKDGAIKKIKTKDENLELQPPLRKFVKGDKIRYINSDSQHDGLIGVVNDIRAPESKNPFYSISLKNDKGNLILLETHADNLLLLEEATDSDKLVFGQPVKYINKDSKYNGRFGKYDGERTKADGTHQLSVKFDDTNVVTRLWVDEGTLVATGEAPVTTTTTTYPITRGGKKKKVKEKEEVLKPVIVYNRRPVVKKAYIPPEEEPTEEERS